MAVRIDSAGGITADESARAALRPGDYRVISAGERFVVLAKAAGRMGLAGEIDGAGSLIEIFHFVHQNKWTGRLEVDAEGLHKTLLFRDGCAVGATSNVAEDRVGAILFRFGAITAAQLDAAVKLTSPSVRLGQLLIEQGALTQTDLFRYMRKQVEEIAYSLFALGAGFFAFERLADADVPATSVEIAADHLVFEGVQRLDELSYFREKLPSTAVVLERKVSEVRDPNFSESELAVFALVDGVRSLAEIARASQLGEFETTKLAYHLLQSNLVAAKPKESPSDTLIDDTNRVLAQIFAATTRRNADKRYRDALITLLATAGDAGPLLTGIALDASGTIDAATLRARVAKLDPGEQRPLLEHWLHELIFFAVFFAGEVVGANDAPFSAELEQLRRALPF